jgi:hypothetical protein
MELIEVRDDFTRRYDSAWVTCPNSPDDPNLGQPFANRYIDEPEMTDQLGFEGICLNQAHQNAYRTCPLPISKQLTRPVVPSTPCW